MFFHGGKVLGILTAHLHAKAEIASLKVLVVIRPSLWSSGDAAKIPSVEFSSEAGKLGLLEVLWQNFRSKPLLVVNDESFSVRQPRNDIRVLVNGENVHELMYQIK
jgi:hypothetical protein